MNGTLHREFFRQATGTFGPEEPAALRVPTSQLTRARPLGRLAEQARTLAAGRSSWSTFQAALDAEAQARAPAQAGSARSRRP